jgi:hypothetical protein
MNYAKQDGVSTLLQHGFRYLLPNPQISCIVLQVEYVVMPLFLGPFLPSRCISSNQD